MRRLGMKPSRRGQLQVFTQAITSYW